MMIATTLIMTTSRNRPTKSPISPVRMRVNVRTSPLGNRATIPAKMMRDIPFPIPLSVICSPSHMRNAVPEVNVSTVMRRNAQPGWYTTDAACPTPPTFSIPTAIPNP